MLMNKLMEAEKLIDCISRYGSAYTQSGKDMSPAEFKKNMLDEHANGTLSADAISFCLSVIERNAIIHYRIIHEGQLPMIQ